MQAFTRLTGVAVPIDLPNIDTDRVIPARFLRKAQGSAGYDRYLFHDVRFNADGSEKPEFVLNQGAYRPATVVVAAENFGCGSSREAAVWALMAYGIRVVIAPEPRRHLPPEQPQERPAPRDPARRHRGRDARASSTRAPAPPSPPTSRPRR